MGYYRKLASSGSQFHLKSGHSKANKKLLAFVICFLIAAGLWIIIALNKNYKSSITFYLRTADKKSTLKVTAKIYGEGFDLMKEKYARGRLTIDLPPGKHRLDAEELIREKIELNDGLEYSNFKPAIVEADQVQ